MSTLRTGCLFWTLNFTTVKLFIDLSSGMWVGDCSGRYMTTEQLYWSQLTLRMSNRTFYSPSWLEAERRRFYATSWLGDETTCFWECLFACQRVTHTLSLVLFLYPLNPSLALHVTLFPDFEFWKLRQPNILEHVSKLLQKRIEHGFDWWFQTCFDSMPQSLRWC